MEIVDVHGNLLVVAAVTLFLHSFSLAMGVEGVLCKDLFTSGAQALEEKAGLHSSDHIVFFLRNKITSLHLKVLFVLAFALLDVVAQALLLNAGPDHLLLVLSELLIRDGWL